MNSVIRNVDRPGRGYSFDAIRAKVLYGGKKRKTDYEYIKVALALKTKGPKVDRTFYVDVPPKLHKEKKRREK